jgi:hypothetical protein
MAVTVPAAYDPILLADLKGRLSADAGAEILERLLLNTNYLYARGARWPFFSAACYGTAIANQFFFSRIPTPSADNLSYDVRLSWWQSNAGATITVDIDTSTTGSGGAWAAGINATHASGTNVTQWLHSSTLPLTAAMNALRFDISADAGTVQLHHVLITPTPLAAITSGTKTSGFIGYDPALLNATAGSPVNTEMINRVRANVASILNDRRTCALGFMWEDTQASTIRKQASAVSNRSNLAPASLPGFIGETVTVEAAGTTSAAGTTKLIVGTGGDETDPMTMAGVDQSEAMDISTERPDFYMTWQHDGAKTITPKFVIVHHTWAEPTTFLDLSVNPTPPALLEFLITLNGLVETAATSAAPRVNAEKGFPVPAHPCYARQAGTGAGLIDFYWHVAVGPGNHSMRGLWGRCDAADGTPAGTTTTLYSHSTGSGGGTLGATVNAIHVPTEVEGVGVDGFASGDVRQFYIVTSSNAFEDPAAGAFPNRRYVIDPGTLDVAFEECWGNQYNAFSGQLVLNNPLA